ncbi:amidase domain-containing protein [Lactococcus lactis]|uniref:amidase domain-containing protein n=1 Tax=Lactococcus lactis TaxID=1358 RepID=UPI001C114D96|nr:amidase domain-containing protein [Lactococcus lactis]MBU5243349.1 amidase domain-containing protein [Lactococcus lactis]MDT2858008.1 amidase domain-containing protein [Lactococcus lactis]
MTNNDKTKRLKKEKFIAGTALILGMTTFGVAGHADGVTVGNSSDASGISSEASTVVSSSAATLSSAVGSSDTSSSTGSSSSSSGTGSSSSSSSTGSSSSSSGTGSSSSSSNSNGSSSSSSTGNSSSSSKPSTSGSTSKPSNPSSSTNNNSTSNSSTTTQAPSTSVSTTAPSASTSTAAPSNYSQDNAYYQTSTAAQIPNSSVDSAPSIYAGPVLKTIEAAKSIDKIDTSSTEAFIKSIADRVRILAGKNNLYASIILAQAILESGSGQSNMSQQYFNIFNITGAYLGKSISFKTEEFSGNNPYYIEQSFRVYSNYDQALDDYINLMIKGTTWNSEIYAGAWKSHAKTYQEAAQALQGIFATDPAYAQKLIEIIQEYKLDAYDNVDSTTQVVDSKIPESPLVASKLDNSAYPEYNGVEYPGADSYAFGNCTQYVYNRIIQLGGLVGTHMGNGGEWGINAQAQGYFTTTVPTEGYAVSFPPGVAGSSSEYGHVAFVEKVYSDNSILVSEMNVKGNNIVSERHISVGVAALATYIQPK